MSPQKTQPKQGPEAPDDQETGKDEKKARAGKKERDRPETQAKQAAAGKKEAKAGGKIGPEPEPEPETAGPSPGDSPPEEEEGEGEEKTVPFVDIPQDSRAIWAVQRFFLFSLVLTTLKILVSYLAAYQSIRAIAIDAVLDLLVSGLGIYLIQWQQKVFARVRDGSQDLKVNEAGAVGIAAMQGLILLIGGLVVFFQSLFTPQVPAPTTTFPIVPALILSGIISAKSVLYVIHAQDSAATGNIAVHSLLTNLKIDIITNVSAWGILIVTSFSYSPWIVFDQFIAVFIGLWMAGSGVRYMGPLYRLILANLPELEEEREGARARDRARDRDRDAARDRDQDRDVSREHERDRPTKRPRATS